MKSKLTALTLALLVFAGSDTLADPLGTAFTYQGRLDFNGQPANGNYSMSFTLFDGPASGANLVGETKLWPVGVASGLFTAELDFGVNVLSGQARWLEIGVSANGGGTLTTLVPRQPLTPAPYALYAPSAGTAAASSSLVGTLPDAQLSGNVVLRAGGNTFTGNQEVSSGNLTLASGKLGIGTTNPESSLQVNGGIRARGGPPGAFGGNDNGYAFGDPGDDDTGMFSSADGQLEFYSNAEELMRLGPNGTVGIGTTKPTAKLEVVGTVKATSFVGDGSALTGISSDQVADNSITAAKLVSDAASLAKISAGAMADAAGNIGIGTAAPQAKLDVNGSVQVSGYLAIDFQERNVAGLVPGLVFGNGGGGGIAYHQAPGDNPHRLDFYTSWEPRLSVTANGNVGIGIGSAVPAAKLEVAGVVKATNFVGDGSGLTGISGGALADNSIPAAKLVSDADSLAKVSAGVMASVAGNIGIGTSAPKFPLHVNFSGTGSSVLASVLEPNLTAGAFDQIYLGRTPDAGGCATLTYSYSLKSAATLSSLSLGLWGNPWSLNILGNGNVGIGARLPQSRLEIDGQDALSMVGYQPFLTLLDNNSSARSRIQGVGGDISFQTEGYINGSGPNGWALLNGQGNLSVGTLTIRGGADLAEPFPMKEDNLGKGSVVVIDEEHPGQLMLSTRAYDTRVAGVISGANGINPGIALHQEGTLDRGENVALTGRVYVKADASRGAIKPGDLLTTSDSPGHAMKVLDYAKAQGAILGKAMSGLDAGTGLVLVLVTLQ